MRHAEVANEATGPAHYASPLPPLGGAEVLAAFIDMCHALGHLHAQQPPMAHRDVKPENFLRSAEDGRWKLADFGSVRRVVYRYEGVCTGLAHEEARRYTAVTPPLKCRYTTVMPA